MILCPMQAETQSRVTHLHEISIQQIFCSLDLTFINLYM